MEKITFQFPERAKVKDLEKIAKSYNLDLKESTKKGSSALVWYDVVVDSLGTMGSIASLLSLFMYIKEKFGKREVIKIEISIDGEIEEQTLDNLINYLTHLKNSKNDSTNQ